MTKIFITACIVVACFIAACESKNMDDCGELQRVCDGTSTANGKYLKMTKDDACLGAQLCR